MTESTFPCPNCGHTLDRNDIMRGFVECRACVRRIDCRSSNNQTNESQTVVVNELESPLSDVVQLNVYPPRIFMKVFGVLQLLYWSLDLLFSQSGMTSLYSTLTRFVIGVSMLVLARKVTDAGTIRDEKILAFAVYILLVKIFLIIGIDQFFYASDILSNSLGLDPKAYKPGGVLVVIILIQLITMARREIRENNGLSKLFVDDIFGFMKRGKKP